MRSRRREGKRDAILNVRALGGHGLHRIITVAKFADLGKDGRMLWMLERMVNFKALSDWLAFGCNRWVGFSCVGQFTTQCKARESGAFFPDVVNHVGTACCNIVSRSLPTEPKLLCWRYSVVAITWDSDRSVNSTALISQNPGSNPGSASEKKPEGILLG